MLVGGAEGLTPASHARFESCSSKLAICPSASLSSSVESTWCSVSNAMAPALERSAHPRYDELTFNGTQMVFEPAKLSRDEHAAASRRLFLPAHPRTVLAFLTQAEKAELCSRPENYGRNPDPSRTCHVSSLRTALAAALRGLSSIDGAMPRLCHRKPVRSAEPAGTLLIGRNLCVC